jgi:hypothetical protein
MVWFTFRYNYTLTRANSQEVKRAFFAIRLTGRIAQTAKWI